MTGKVFMIRSISTLLTTLLVILPSVALAEEVPTCPALTPPGIAILVVSILLSLGFVNRQGN